MATRERMSVLDLPFWAYGNTTTRQQIAMAIQFDGAPSRELLRERLGAALTAFPRLHQVVAETPLRVARPFWRDVDVDVDAHFRDADLGDDADFDDVLALLSRVQSQPFDPSRPMWRAWWCRLGDGSTALAFVIHHSCADGLSISDLARALSDDPAPRRTPAPAPTPPSAAAPPPPETIGDRGGDRGGDSGGDSGGDRGGDAGGEGDGDGDGLVGAARNFLSHLGRTRAPVWTGPLSQARRLDTTAVALADLRGLRRTHGVAFNDVVQTVVGLAVASILEDPTPDEVVFSMPLLVTDRAPDAVTGELTSNQVSLNLRVPLTLSPLAMLAAVAERTTELRDEVGDVKRMVAVASRMPRQAVMAVTRRKISGANMISSNVPSDNMAVYDGVPVRRFAFWSPIAPSCPVAVTIATCGDTVEFCVQWDPRRAPEAAELSAALPRALRALQEATAASAPPTDDAPDDGPT
jgi:diacylglycerol O-acyltransferase